jgi:hypothetical protein
MRPPQVYDPLAMLGRLELCVMLQYCCLSLARGSLHSDRLWISATRVRLASVSPSMSRCVMARLVWPASAWTSRRLPPTCETVRAARVMKVRRPECDEQLSIFREVVSR